jgi:hypothetical protein
MEGVRRLLIFTMIAAVIYTGWTFLARRFPGGRWVPPADRQATAREAEFERIYGGSAVKILQFYTRDGSLTEGAGSVICYGVLNAKSVEIQPAVDGVFPALNRCVSVTPERDTRYTLTAEGNDGQKVSASFVLAVHPDETLLPKITSFLIAGQQKDYRGRTVFLLSFAAQNVETVDIDPPAFPTLHGSPVGRFYVAPEKTTTYTLIVTGKHGHQARQHLTVEVPIS